MSTPGPTVDAVTVYPDGASVTRVITVDLAAGDNTLVANDFPLTLDPSSLRVEGEAGAKLTIGAIDTTAAARRAAGQSAGTRQAHRGAEGRARQSRGRNQCRHRAPQVRRAFCRKPRRRGWARRARRVRSTSGAQPLPRSRRKSQARTPRSATPNASSATSTARSQDSRPTARPSRRASSRFGSISPPMPRPRRRCG